jgi:hypothetical protein
MMAETPNVTQGFRNHFNRLVNVSYKVEELFHNAQEVIAGREVDSDGDFIDIEEEDKD